MPRAERPVRTILAARDVLADSGCADRLVMRLLVNQVAHHRGLRLPAWPTMSAQAAPAEITAARAKLAELDVTGWDLADLGTAYEHLLGLAYAWFTPPVVAKAMCRLSIGPQLDRLADHPDPGNVLQVLAVDPSCGAGVFLVHAARLIAARYAERLFGEVTDLTVRAVMREVMAECVFGIDLDPVAVDLAKAALWMELDGKPPFGFMDRNVIVGDTLAGPDVQPPRLAERLAERGDSETGAA